MFRTDPQKDRYTQGEELVRTRPKAIQHIVYTSDFEKSASSGEGAKENYSKEILSEARGEEGARWEEDQDQWRRGKESSEWWHDSAGDSQHQLCSGEPVRALLPELQGRLQGEQVQAFRDDVLFLENRSAAAGEKTLASIEFYNHTGKTSELRVHNLATPVCAGDQGRGRPCSRQDWSFQQHSAVGQPRDKELVGTSPAPDVTKKESRREMVPV